MDATEIPALPFIDEHATVVETSADAVWRALTARMDGARGFRVAVSTPGQELALVGHHPFSRYALIFHLDEADQGHTRLRAESRATFPGPAGAVYRRLVIGTGAHALLVRHMLTKVRKSAA
ncbi:hypothetical protein EJ357_08085 [Streptomyces cyaneochromogenes]|uniref:DUF2867 domain-containing protein n=1 Tax=Streptomyces cyaneochromogenes TaxID=2496836 RepID=A0A3Q9EQQ2_9ACTN|nr:hypothetical protein [Streptomyces cyaneochromogenes]AZQ33415.1 hypothetical protein EJ357_08085 [Streptomyces cyaneochromogenes]